MIAVTARARELRAIALTDFPASGTNLTRIMWVHKLYSYASLQCLIFNKLLKLSKRPGLVDIPLPLSNPGSFPNVSQVFHNENIIGTGSFHYPLADNMVKVADYPTFLARQPLQEPFSPFSAFGLKRSPQIRKTPPYMHSLLARESETIRGGSKVIDAEVYANGICALRSRNWLGKDDIDIEPSLPSRLAIDQGSRGWYLPFKEMPLIVTQDKVNFDSTLNSRKRYHFFGGDITENSLVIGHRGWFKLLDLAEFLFRRFGYPGDGSYGKISGQIKSLPKLIIAKVLEFHFVSCVVLLRDLQHIVTSIGEALKSSPESFFLLRSSIQFTRDCFNKLHTNIKYITLGKTFQGRSYAPIPPPPEGGGFLGAIL